MQAGAERGEGRRAWLTREPFIWSPCHHGGPHGFGPHHPPCRPPGPRGSGVEAGELVMEWGTSLGTRIPAPMPGGGVSPAGWELLRRRGRASHRPPENSQPPQKEPVVGIDAPYPFSCRWGMRHRGTAREKKPAATTTVKITDPGFPSATKSEQKANHFEQPGANKKRRKSERRCLREGKQTNTH